MRILIVDDEQSIREQLEDLLKKQKYLVDTVSDGEQAIRRILEQPYDLIVLDIMLPKINGLEVLREIRSEKIDTPILMLTAKGALNDKVKGLDAGADDYLPKPFSTAEFMARLRALLRRSSHVGNAVLKLKNISLNTMTREITINGNPTSLTPKEFAILEFLMYNKNRSVSRFTLAEHIWGDEFDPFTMSNYIDVHIKNLRRKIGDPNGELLQTLRGIGYILKED
ncbi:MAG: response regulator transcription factor [Dissulfuribacterales bacterium]